MSLAGQGQAGRELQVPRACSFLLCHPCMVEHPNTRTVLQCLWIYSFSCCEFSSLRNGPKEKIH